MAQHRLDISELDFENIKSSLKRFLSNQTQFKDYDFEGSSMAGFGMHYNVSSTWQFNLESLFKYHLKPLTRTQNFSPYIISFNFGVEYKF